MWQSPPFVIIMALVATAVGVVFYYETRRAWVLYRQRMSVLRDIPGYWFPRGLANKRSGSLDRAIEDFSRVIHADPQSLRPLTDEYRLLALYERGQLWAQREPDSHDLTVEDLSEAIRLHPKSVPGNSLGPETGNAPIGQYPSVGELYHRRGRSHAALGMLGEALEDYSATIEFIVAGAADSSGRFPDPAVEDDLYFLFRNPYFDRGSVYKDLGRYEEAVDNFTQAEDFFKRHDPEAVAGAYHDRGLAYLEWGKYAEALADLDVAISEYERDSSPDAPPEIHAERTAALESLGQIAEAESNG